MSTSIALNNIKFADRTGKLVVREDYFLVFNNEEDIEAFIQERYQYWCKVLKKELTISPNKNEVIVELDIKKVFRYVCKYLNVNYPNIYERNRSAEYVNARRMGSIICLEQGQSLTDIGKVLNIQHDVIIHYRKRHKDYIETDKNYLQKFEAVKDFVHENLKLYHENTMDETAK